MQSRRFAFKALQVSKIMRPTPTPTGRETKGVNGSQDHFRAQAGGQTKQHQGGHVEGCIKNLTVKCFGNNHLFCRPKKYPTNLETSKFFEHMQNKGTPRKFSLLIETYRIHPKSVADWPLNFADPDLLHYFDPKAIFSLYIFFAWMKNCLWEGLKMFQDKKHFL